jgi:SAM-dependent methyltransferase
MTAVDISPLAIDRARHKASKAGVQVDFRATDVLEGAHLGTFDFLFDRGCFHTFDPPSDRNAFADNVRRHLNPAGLWLSILGSSDGPAREKGPPRWSAQEIMSPVEPLFEILHLAATHFDSDQPDPPRAWVCLMRRR